MKVAKLLYEQGVWTKESNPDSLDYKEAQLVIGFGDRNLLTEEFYDKLKSLFPKANISLSSSSGEIFRKEVFTNSVTVTALKFQSSTTKVAEVNIKDFNNSSDAGKALIEKLIDKDLKWIFVISDGSSVNGSELVKGINLVRPYHVLVSGGLAGDGIAFEKTVVGLNKVPESGNIVAFGFYGNNLRISHAVSGGWEGFGMEKTVTKSIGNCLYEIDGKNVITLYKKYLGKYAEQLPGSALLFPLSLKLEKEKSSVVRTILSIDEVENKMVFAGEIPEGSKVRFMKANLDILIDAANIAAQHCLDIEPVPPKLSILVSCVGRRIILGNRTSEEVDTIVDVFGQNTAIVGFYSYGEISPNLPFENSELHNQTITITGINEII